MKTQSPSISDYRLQHELTGDPFPPSVVDGLFYTTSELNHRLELVKHLLEFSEQLLIVSAAEGAGKTSLCRQLVEKAEPGWAIHLLSAETGWDSAELTQRIVDDEAEQAEPQLKSAERLHNYLEHCLRNDKKAILFIDGAHHLDIETLRFVIELACVPDTTQRWRVVLFSEDSLRDKLEDTQIKTLNTGLFHFIDILPLSLEQTEAYIAYRLSKCGVSSMAMFDEREIKQIHKISAGLPGKINHLARQSLIKPAVRTSSTNSENKGPVSFTRKTIISLLLIGLVALAWIGLSHNAGDPVITDSINLPPESNTLIDSEAAQALLDLEKTKTAEVVEPPAQQVIEPEADDEAPPVEPAPAPITVVEKVEEPLPEPNKVETIAPSPKPDNKTIVPAALASLKDAAWLQQQSPSSYVLQLIGAVEIDTIVSFVQSKGMAPGKLAWFKTEQAGKDWYVLVYGHYLSRELARLDIQSLSSELKKLHPWPRSLADIHAAIR